MGCEIHKGRPTVEERWGVVCVRAKGVQHCLVVTSCACPHAAACSVMRGAWMHNLAQGMPKACPATQVHCYTVEY